MDCLVACRNTHNFYSVDTILIFVLSLVAATIILLQVACCINETILPTRSNSEKISASPASSSNSD